MPLPDCDPWPANTVRFSQQQAACVEHSGRAGEQELPDVTAWLTVIDSLQRLAVDGVTGAQPLSEYRKCEGEANAHNAYVQLMALSPPIQANVAELKQVALWQLGNLLCGNNA